MGTAKRVIVGFGVFCFVVFAISLVAPIIIPTHGLTACEKIILLCIPIVAFYMAGPEGPQRYWFYFGIACSAVVLLLLLDFVLFDSEGRRHRLPLDAYWSAKIAVIVIYSSFSPLLAAVIRSKLDAAGKLSKNGSTRRG
ncbi:MAG: hypothetical protein NTY53_03030 [Kiritimatiellaeota bacterium]|nr:hypothetical protein [Kiritimatiellota bacterium]